MSFFLKLLIKHLDIGWVIVLIYTELKEFEFYPPTSTKWNGRFMCLVMASFISTSLQDIVTHYFTWWKLVDENSIVSRYLGINSIPNTGFSLVTVGKKDLRNQNIWTDSLFDPNRCGIFGMLIIRGGWYTRWQTIDCWGYNFYLTSTISISYKRCDV